MNKSFFADKIVEWYEANRRGLPWRETSDPYKIWLSEIILQQTRVAQGLPYYLKFIAQYPSVRALAGAREQSILRLWQGLGYYTRARNLHRCAKEIVKNHGGKFPRTAAELQKLPGVGVYTAAAIVSIAFGESIAAVDGNAYRVLSRVFGMEDDINSARGRSRFSLLANKLIIGATPQKFNQAIMDFGATHCVPRNPLCDLCIFRKECVARARNLQDTLPVKLKRPAVRKRYFYYFVIEHDGKKLMQKRGSGDIWQGLYDFYLVESGKPQKPRDLFLHDPFLKRVRGKILEKKTSESYKHRLTHQRLFARFIPVGIPNSRSNSAMIKSEKMRFYSALEIDKLPKPVLVDRYLRDNPIL